MQHLQLKRMINKGRKMLSDCCLTSKESDDLFVGIKFKDGKPIVIFPHGYSIPKDDVDCRRDIFRLLAVLQRFSEHREGNNNKQNHEIKTIPITSYQFIIQDFLSHGYYTEKEIRYIQSQRGKINWKRTIQQEQAQIDNGNVVYLNFQVKTNQINSNNLISNIHKCCVYYCFLKFGWLYFSSEFVPKKPEIPLNKKLFVSVLTQAINDTYNDQKRHLFQSMINVIQDTEEDLSLNSIAIGVKKFDPIWERLIDYVFGEDEIERYFPHATWHIIKNGNVSKSSTLEPDTIMKSKGKVFVLDAKYYQYGISNNPHDLPPTSSIQKQITYGKHIVELGEAPENSVYNAFILPFEATSDECPYKFVSVATADWEQYTSNTLNYAYVLGILLDTRWLITSYSRHNEKEIEKLAEEIEESLHTYKSLVGL